MEGRGGEPLKDTGERMIPTEPGEVSVVFSRHAFAYRFARGFVSGMRVIDVGCGTGYGCRILAEEASSVLGVDHDEDAVSYCRSNYPSPNVAYAVLDAEGLKLDRTFDAAVSLQVIEHMRDAGAFLDRLKRIVRPRGLVIISTPNARAKHGEGEGNPFHFSEMSCAEFRSLLGEKFDEFDLRGIGYSSRNPLREALQKLPFYSTLGRMLRRGSRIKKVAARSLKLTDYRIVDLDVDREAIDLLAVCRVS